MERVLSRRFNLDNLLEKSEALNSEFSKVFDYGPVNDDKRVTSS